METTTKRRMTTSELIHFTYLHEILAEAQGVQQVDAAIDAIEAFKAEVAASR